jgi:DNA polymerase III subunit beta
VIRLAILPGDECAPGHLTISATAAEIGDNEEEVDAIVEGDPVNVAFNARYLADVLGVLSTTQITLETSSPDSPGVIKPAGPDIMFTHVIMPMHVTR